MEALFELSSPSPLGGERSTSPPLPSSPHKLQDMSHKEGYPVLCCSSSGDEREELTSLSCDGFVRRGLLLCVLGCSECFEEYFTSDVCSLFGHMTVTCHVLQQNIITSFLSFTRHFNNLPNRKSFHFCCKFLHFVDSQVSRILSTTPTTDSHMILDDIITHLTNTITALESRDQLKGEGVHVLLHVYWTLISTLYKAVRNNNNGGEYVTRFNEKCNMIIKSLMKERKDIFDISTVFKNSTPSLFPCSCFLEVWLLVAKTIDQVANSNRTPSFLEVLYSSLSSDDSLSFKWWVMAQGTRLYGYTNEGVWLDNYETVGSWKIIDDLINETFKRNNDEVVIRWSLYCCNYIHWHWTPPTYSVLIFAWEYYYRHLNNTFLISSFESKELLLSESCSYDEIREVIIKSCDFSVTSNFCSSSSFELFLKLLAKCLSDGCHGNQIWRKLKTRIYSKFSRPKVLELSRTGLNNVIRLFLVICYYCYHDNSIEVGKQLYSLLNYRQLISSNERNLTVIWKGIFTLLILCNSRGSPVDVNMLTKIEKQLETITNVYISEGPQTGNGGGDICVTIATILEGIVLLVTERFPAIQYLIGPYIGNLIKGMGKLFPDVLKSINSIISNISVQLAELARPVAMETNVDTQLTGKLKSLLNDIAQCCVPPLLSLLGDSALIPQLHLIVETAVTMTTSICEWLSSQDQLCLSVFEGFGLSVTTHSDVVILYLSQVLSYSSVTERLLSSDEIQLRLCHSWLVSEVLSSSSSSSSLTRSIASLPVVSCLLNEGTGNIEYSDPMTLLLQLLKGINNNYGKDRSVKWRSYLIIIIGDIVPVIESSLSSSIAINNVYKVTSGLVRHCSRLIYSKADSKCLLPRLLTILILPVSLSRQLPGVPTLIRRHLYHFLHGLFIIDQDDFINRMIKQIFSTYFLKYLQSDAGSSPCPAPSSTNPFVLLLSPALSHSPSLHSRGTFLRVIDLINRQQLIITQSNDNVLLVLNFIYSILNQVKQYGLLLEATVLLLGNLLRLHLSSTTSSFQVISKLLKLLLQTCRGHMDELPCSRLLPLVREYIVNTACTNKDSVFDPLVAIATHHPTLVEETIPLAMRLIEEHEDKRGCGQDPVLRKSYQRLENSLN